MEPWHYPALFICGILIGFINTIAAGGSLITLPLLIFLGLPSITANGTNRVGVFLQAISATINFYRKGIRQIRFAIILGIPAAIGSILGSQIAIRLSDEVFNKILATVMFVVLGLMLAKPKSMSKNRPTSFAWMSKRGILLLIIFFMVGVYGGFIQAGVGFVMIAALSYLTPLSLTAINATKVIVVIAFNTIALSTFILKGHVLWPVGLCLAAGMSIGGWMAAHFSVKVPEKWVQRIIIFAVLLCALKLILSANL